MANTTPHLLPRGERLLQGTIAELLSDSATEVEVNNPPSVDELPTYFELDPSSDNPETIRVYDVSGNIIYFERGVYNSGVGREHLPNTPYKQKITSQHWKKVVDAVEQGYLPEDPSITLTRDSATQFTIEGVDRTDLYTEGRVLRFNGSDANIAIVDFSSLATSDTEVTLKVGTVPNPITKVELAIGARGANDLTAIVSVLQAGGYQYAADSGAADAYVVDLDPEIAAYIAGMVVVFKAANTNTTASTINVNSLGTKAIKKMNDQDLVAGDIEADQIVVVAYDGTNFQMLSQLAAPSGWTPARATWTYASASTFTIAGVDLTSVYTKGTRLRFKQGGGYKYAVVVASSFSTNTTVTILVNTDHSIANATITDNDFSYQASPQGYPNWFNFSSTITSTAGTLTTASASGIISIIGDMAIIRLTESITTNGTGSGAVRVTVPLTSIGPGVFYGRETNATGNMVQGLIQHATSHVDLATYSNAYPGGNNTSITANGFYKF